MCTHFSVVKGVREHLDCWVISPALNLYTNHNVLPMRFLALGLHYDLFHKIL